MITTESHLDRFCYYYFLKFLYGKKKELLDLMFMEIQRRVDYRSFLMVLRRMEVLGEDAFNFFLEENKDSSTDKEYDFFFDSLDEMYGSKGRDYLRALKIFLYATYLEYHIDHAGRAFSFMTFFANQEAIRLELRHNYPMTFYIVGTKFIVDKKNVEHDFANLKIAMNFHKLEELSSIEQVDDLLSGLEAYTDDEFIISVLGQVRKLLNI